MYNKIQERPGQTAGQQLLRKKLFLLGILFVCCVWVLFQIDLQSSSKLLVIHQPILQDNFTQGFLVNTKGCRIQDLDPFDVAITKFIYDEAPLICNKDNLGMLVKSNENSLYVDTSLLPTYNLTEDTINCCYRPFWRVELPPQEVKINPNKADTTIRYANYCIPFMYPTRVEEQFITVLCQLENDTYIDYFNFVLINEGVEQKFSQKEDEQVSVLVIGVDSISRLNLYRQMPKTLQFLKDSVNVVELLGYNKVGDNTFPNLIPVLSGLSEGELEKNCWKSTNDVFDNCPFVWKTYKDNGFITGFGEDAARIGLFNYLKPGFRKQPTDFYLQAFNLEAEDEIGHEKWLNAVLCLGKRLNLEVLLDTAKQFAVNLKNLPSFGFFWETSLSHDYLNLPAYGDKHYLKLFQELQFHGIFDNSIIIFMSDHGIRWGDIRTTYQGYLEERLPFLIISYPDWFEQKYPLAVSNLRANRRKLTSPYDLHETLKDLINLKNITKEILQSRLKSPHITNGTSLFLLMNDSRTCYDAGIPEIWCTCHQSETASTKDENVKSSAVTVVIFLNKLLEGYVQCRKLYLNKIIGARLERVPIIVEESRLQQSYLIDYTVTVETIPGKAVFEATVRYSRSNDKYLVVPPISRINTYGNQSYCISHYLLKLYCYCDSYWGS